MIIHNYHPITKQYLGASFADQSPLEVDVYHIPANATHISPPPLTANTNALFDIETNSWSIVPDYTQTPFYNKRDGSIAPIALGEEPDLELVTPDARPDSFHIWSSSGWILDKKALIKEVSVKIKSYRDAIIDGGILYRDKWWHTNADSLTRYSMLNVVASNQPASRQKSNAAITIAGSDVEWSTMDKSLVVVHCEDPSRLLSSILERTYLAHAVADIHIALASDAEDPRKYDYSTDWPACFAPVEIA